MRLGIGGLVATSYGTGPYRIRHITRNCTCPDYVEEINSRGQASPRKPHIHLAYTGPDGKGAYWLNGYDEETLVHCNGRDRLMLLPPDRPVQLTLF